MRLSGSVWVMRQGRTVAQYRTIRIDSRTIVATFTDVVTEQAYTEHA